MMLAKSRCSIQIDSKILYADDFKWNMDYEFMKNKFDEIYNSGKRLSNRFYFDKINEKFVGKLAITNTEIEIPENFIISITKHIEKALKQGYADFVFFPDMGHNHFYMPTPHWNEIYRGLNDFQQIYALMINDPSLIMLYHTAEQLLLTDSNKRLLNDTYTQKRYYTRNITGDNLASYNIDIHFAPLNEFNTIRALDGYKLWSAGVNISSSLNGCFPYKYNGETLYFDISFFDLGYSPNNNYSDFKIFPNSDVESFSLREQFQNGWSRERYRPPLSQ